MKSLAEILATLSEKDTGKYLKHEWQLYAYNLATWLGDMKRISFYMKLAKNENRNLLQKAWDFVKESKPNSRIGLFHWKFKELKKQQVQKEKVAKDIEESSS